ncbi:MAG: NUDIX domain-containing protein [Pyrinomonadaceae bacterium]|nr:NUDIX domain-containing protein [Pyrinomonadaceae bacterium]
MLKKFVAKFWKRLPPSVRLQIVRAAQQKFTVSTAAIVVNDDDKILLLDHALRPYSPWGLPGGFIDRSEQPESAIRREIMEEIGIELEALKLYRIRTIRRHVEILFTAKPLGSVEIRSREINDFGWFALDDFPSGVGQTLPDLVRSIVEEERLFNKK